MLQTYIVPPLKKNPKTTTKTPTRIHHQLLPNLMKINSFKYRSLHVVPCLCSDFCGDYLIIDAKTL
jgi:hypothetical protein